MAVKMLLILLQIISFFLLAYSDGGDELYYYREMGNRGINYCSLQNQSLEFHNCFDDDRFRPWFYSNYGTEKLDLAIFNDRKIKNSLNIDSDKFGFPVYVFTPRYENHFELSIWNDGKGDMFHSFKTWLVYETNGGYNIPKYGDSHDDLEYPTVYINQKKSKNIWVFIKDKENICVISVPFDTFREHYGGMIKITNFHRITNYPTHNYLLKFFAFDPLLSCFVSLYWDGDMTHDPETHAYHFFEDDPEAPQTQMESIVLKDFDKQLLNASRNGLFHDIKPVFQSYGGQIFVYGRHPTTGHGFIGHYKDEIDYVTKIITDPNSTVVPLFYIKEEYIKHHRFGEYHLRPTTPEPSTTLHPSTISPPSTPQQQSTEQEPFKYPSTSTKKSDAKEMFPTFKLFSAVFLAFIGFYFIY